MRARVAGGGRLRRCGVGCPDGAVGVGGRRRQVVGRRPFAGRGERRVVAGGETGNTTDVWSTVDLFAGWSDGSPGTAGTLGATESIALPASEPAVATASSRGAIPVSGASKPGRTDHDRISDVLQDASEQMNDRLAERYDPAIDDGADLFGMVIDQKGLYLLISSA